MAFYNDMSLGKYYPANSFIHNLDPRTKLTAVLMLMTGFLFSFHPILLLSFVLISGAIVVLAKIPPSLVFANLKPFLWLFAITMLIHVFWTQGSTLFTLPFLSMQITNEGIKFGILFSVRLALMIIIAAVLTLSTSPIELTDALEKMLSPLKKLRIPVHDIVMMLTLALRFIPTLMEEMQRINNAQLSRGANFSGGILSRLKNIVPLILPLFISSFRREDDLALAMDSRCYTGGQNRTSYKRLQFQIADYITLGASLLFLGCTIWIRINWE